MSSEAALGDLYKLEQGAGGESFALGNHMVVRKRAEDSVSMGERAAGGGWSPGFEQEQAEMVVGQRVTSLQIKGAAIVLFGLGQIAGLFLDQPSPEHEVRGRPLVAQGLFASFQGLHPFACVHEVPELIERALGRRLGREATGGGWPGRVGATRGGACGWAHHDSAGRRGGRRLGQFLGGEGAHLVVRCFRFLVEDGAGRVHDLPVSEGLEIRLGVAHQQPTPGRQHVPELTQNPAGDV